MSGDNGRVHFNEGEGGGFQNGDRVICVKLNAGGGTLFYRQLDFSSDPEFTKEILENELISFIFEFNT